MDYSIVKNGLLFKEGFDYQSPFWVISPNIDGACEFTGNSVILKHIGERITMTMALPNEDKFLIDINVNHTATVPFDIGGVVILSNTDECLEVQTYYDSMQSNQDYFKNIRVIKEDDYFNFLASSDMKKWIEIGNAPTGTANRIGFFLDGLVDEKASDFECLDYTVYKDYGVAIHNLEGVIKSLDCYYENKELVESVNWNYDNSKLYVRLAQIDFNRDITVVGRGDNGTIVFESSFNFIPGSVYKTKSNIAIYINESEVKPNENFGIGRITSDTEYIPFAIKNTSSAVSLVNLLLKIEKQGFKTIGDKFVYIALSSENEEPQNLQYDKKIKIENIYPGDTLRGYLKISRTDGENESVDFDGTNKFKITIDTVM